MLLPIMSASIPRRLVTVRSFMAAKQSLCGATVIRNQSSVVSSHDGTKISFIGLGNMGKPMLRSLLKNADTSLSAVGFDVDTPSCKEIESSTRASIAPSLSSIAHSINDRAEDGKSIDVVITMLPGCQALNSVMSTLTQDIDIIHRTRPLCFVDCSTVSPSTTRHWHSHWTGRSGNSAISWFDAPVSGGTAGASAGTLTFLLGSSSSASACEDDVIAATPFLRPLLHCMGSTVLECGGSGSGAAAKLCNNLALATQMIGICEALHVGEALGVNPIALTNVLNASTAGCWSSKVNNPHPAVALGMERASGKIVPAARGYSGGFATRLMLKDLELAVSSAEESGASVPLAKRAKELYTELAQSGLDDKDFGSMLQHLQNISAGTDI